MSELSPNLVDVNTATESELRSVRGIGKVLAQRIAAARPFATLEDLTRVSGLNAVKVAELRNQLTVSPPAPAAALEAVLAEPSASPDEDAPALAEMPAASTDETPAPVELPAAALVEEPPAPIEALMTPAEALDAPVQAPEGAPALTAEPLPPLPAEEPAPAANPPEPQKPAAAAPNPVTRRELYLTAAGFSLAGMLLGILLILGLLTITSGGLSFVTQGRFSQTQAQVEDLDLRLGFAQSELETQRGRLERVETLGGRISAVEQSLNEARQSLERAQADLAALRQETDVMGERVARAEARTETFQRFLEGLQRVLSELPALP